MWFFRVLWPRFQDEIEEMMAAAVDVHSGDIHYEYYINSLMVRIIVNFVDYMKMIL